MCSEHDSTLICACIVKQRQNNPAEQPAHNGWGAGSRTYNEYQQGPHQRNGQRDNQQRGRWQQRPIGSGGNELPLGRQSRMNFAHPEGAGTLGGLRSAQRSEPQPTATGNSAPVPPGIELYKEEEPKQQQYKDANQASKTEREAASKAVSSEKRQKKAEKTVHREPKDAKKVPKVPQAIIVSISYSPRLSITICACLGSRSPRIEEYSRKCCKYPIQTVHKREAEQEARCFRPRNNQRGPQDCRRLCPGDHRSRTSRRAEEEEQKTQGGGRHYRSGILDRGGHSWPKEKAQERAGKRKGAR